MSEPVILTDCDDCGRVPHSREQRAEGTGDGVVIVTEYVCSECGSVQTEKVQYTDE